MSQYNYDSTYFHGGGSSSSNGRHNPTESASTQPLMSQRQYPPEPTLALQPSATYTPGSGDDFFSPYLPNEDWGGEGEEPLIAASPPSSPQAQRYQSHSRGRNLYGETSWSSPSSQPVSSPAQNDGSDRSLKRHDRASGVIYTPSGSNTGSSRSSPPRSSPPQRPSVSIPPPSAYGLGIDTSFTTVNHLTSPVSTTWIPEKTLEANLAGQSANPITKPRSSRHLKGSMLPVSENEVLETKGKRTISQMDLEYNEPSGGWVHRSLIGTIGRKLSTYRPINGEDRENRRLQRKARALKEDEINATYDTYPIDLSIFAGFDSEVPEQTAQAMRDNQGMTGFAYTGTGDIVDLSSLEGLGADDDDPNDPSASRRNSFAPTRSMTGLAPAEKSYYFPDDPHTPNWKPVTMRPLYLSILQLLSLCIIGFCEYLYQYSVSRGRDTGFEPHLTRFYDIEKMPLVAFALWKYLPTVIAVIFGVLVQLTDAEVKRVEPYYQLARKPKGALAADSLNIEYLTFFAVLCPLQAFRHRHWAVMVSSIAAILSFAAVPPLQAVFLDLNPSRDERIKDPQGLKFIIVDQIWTRLLEAVMGLVFILIGLLQYILYKRRTGLVGDPSGIAGVASMAYKSHMLMDFKGLDRAGTKQIHKQLSKRTYILQRSSLWQAEYLTETERPKEEIRDQNPHPLLLRFKGGIPLILYLITIMVLIPLLTSKKSMQVVLTKSTWFLTVLSISIKMLWEVIDRDLRILQPFYLLYKRHAHSDVLTMDYTATIPGWIIYKTGRNKHYLLCFICTVTLLNEVLTVCMGSLDPVSGEDTPRSQTISLVLAEFIMGLQIIGALTVLYYRRHPFLPRQPGTISSVLAYIYQSHMLTDFTQMETAPTEERRKMLAAKGKLYGFGWFKGKIDGKWHLGIDEEELEREYVHNDQFLGGMLQAVPIDLDHY